MLIIYGANWIWCAVLIRADWNKQPKFFFILREQKGWEMPLLPKLLHGKFVSFAERFLPAKNNLDHLTLCLVKAGGNEEGLKII